MSVANTDVYLYDMLTAALGDDVKVSAGVQLPDEDGKFTQAAAVYQRSGSDAVPTLDNGNQAHALTFNIVLINETQEQITDMEDRVRRHFADQALDVEIVGGVDSIPQGEDEGFARLISARVPMQSASE